MSECHRYLPPQWSAPTDVVADMAGPPVMMVQRYPVGKVLSPASMTSGKNNSRHHHNISFRLRIPKFLWPSGCQHKTRRIDIGGCWTPDSDYPGIVFCVNISGLTMAQKLAWSPHFLRPFDAVFAITPWNRETRGHMWPLVRGKLRDQIDLGREGQTIFQDKIVWRMRQQWVPTIVLKKVHLIFGSDRSSRSHNL